MRGYKTVNDSYIQPVSFTVPRRAEVFQSDIFPPATGIKPGVSATDWLAGKTALPPKIDLESVYDGNAPAEVPADYKPPTSAPAPVAAPAKAASQVKKEPEPESVVERVPPPSISEQKGSISALASKFQDKEEEEEDDDDDSSFEEIVKPVVRHTQPEPTKPVSPVTPRSTTSAPIAETAAKSTAESAPTRPTTIQTTVPPPTAGSQSDPPSASGVESSLKKMMDLLETQTKLMTAQSEKLTQMGAEIDSLKRKVAGGGPDMSERVRQLELELEEARS